MKNNLFLETKRLIIRPFTLKDKHDVFEYSRDPEVGPNAGWERHKTLSDSVNAIKSFINMSLPNFNCAIELKSEKKVIGAISLKSGIFGTFKLPNHGELGYVVNQKYWGQGIAPEASRAVLKHAFETIGCNIVDVKHNAYNIKSKRVIEKLGFKFVRQQKERIINSKGQDMTGIVHEMDRELYKKIYK